MDIQSCVFWGFWGVLEFPGVFLSEPVFRLPITGVVVLAQNNPKRRTPLGVFDAFQAFQAFHLP